MKARSLALAISLFLPFLLITPTHAKANPLICVAYDEGGRGDQSFNDAAAVGLEKAQKAGAFTLESAVTDGSAADRERRVRAFATKRCDLIIAIGAGYAPTIRALASEYPTQQFAILNDSSIEGANVTSIIFAESQGAYLAGFSAALISKSKRVAMVASSNQSSLYIDGFQAGVQAAKKSVTPMVRYTSGAGSAETRELIAAGADVIFVTLPNSSSAVFRAVVSANTQKGRKSTGAIGMIGLVPDQFLAITPANQRFLYATVVKRVDVAIADLISKTILDRQYLDILDFQKGIYGIRYGINNDGITFTTFLPALTAQTPAINRAALQGAKILPTN